ncbi:hypothetical protein YC2023_043893 [Brassica napus]
MIEEEKAAKKKQEEEDAELAAWFVAEIIKEEEAAKNKNQEVNDAQRELEEEDNAQWVKEDDGRKELARTLYSDAVAEIVKEVKSSDTGFGEHVHIIHLKSLEACRLRVEGEHMPFLIELTMLGRGWENEACNVAQYSDAVAEVDEETWEITEMIKEEEAQHEEDDAQLNEAGEAEEEDDPQ